MVTQEKSPFSIVYQDPEFKGRDKRHSVRRLLRLGWLLCMHQSKQTQADELWHLINPEMEAYVTQP